MPTPAEQLRIDASQQERGAAISSCISQILEERPGISQEQATAICIDQANRSMGTREQAVGNTSHRPAGPPAPGA